MNTQLWTPTFPQFVWIVQPNGEYMRAQKLFWSRESITVKAANGMIYEVNRNIRDAADAYVVLS